MRRARLTHARHLVLVSERSLDALCAGIPQARVAQLPGAGHLAFATEAARVAEQVRAFLGAHVYSNEVAANA